MCFKKQLLNIQEQTIPMCGKTTCMGKRPVWLNRELKLQLRGEKREYIISGRRSGNLGDYKDFTKSCRKKIKRDKAQLELALATTVKDNKKCLSKYVESKRKVKECLHH